MHPSPAPPARPDDTGAQARVRRRSPPDNELAVPLATRVVLGRTADLAVALIGVQAFTTGLAFTLAVRLRVARERRLHELVSGHALPVGDEAASRRLLLGVQFADGRTATNMAPGALPDAGEDALQRPVLFSHGGNGGGLHHDQRYWLSPLPPDGPLTMVCAWPALGIPERQHLLDGKALRAAGLAADVLWPPSDPDQPAAPAAPSVPAGGWFDAALSETRRAQESS